MLTKKQTNVSPVFPLDWKCGIFHIFGSKVQHISGCCWKGLPLPTQVFYSHITTSPARNLVQHHCNRFRDIVYFTDAFGDCKWFYMVKHKVITLYSPETFQNTILGHDSITFQTENYPCVVLLLNQTDVHQCENNPEYFTFHWVKVVLHVRISPERFVAQWFHERPIYIWILSKWYLHIRLSRKLGQHFHNSSSSPHYPTSITELVTHSPATLPNSPAKSIPVPYGQSSSGSISRTFLS